MYTLVFLFGRVSAAFANFASDIIFATLCKYTTTYPMLKHLLQQYTLPPQEQWCPYSNMTFPNHYKNPDYNYHPCHKYRTPYLLYLHLQEVNLASINISYYATQNELLTKTFLYVYSMTF